MSYVLDGCGAAAVAAVAGLVRDGRVRDGRVQGGRVRVRGGQRVPA
ncbi:MAG TPA: hypothetical protein VIZ20_04050 [Streptosporangiaceae bacterium]